MKGLAIFAIVLICGSCIGLQHVFNYWIRQDVLKTPLPIIGIYGIIISVVVLAFTIYEAIQIF